MLKKVLFSVMCLLFSMQSLGESSQNEIQAYCDEEISIKDIVVSAVPFGVFMIYHLALPLGKPYPMIGRRTEAKTHLATVLMSVTEIAMLSKNYPSKTFDFIASYMIPFILVGTTFNLNWLFSKPIPMLVPQAGRYIVPAILSSSFWYWKSHFSECQMHNNNSTQ